ncbi:MAG: bifunctional tetrahydrofolate synthase/dihydrofolate synthase, partial [Nevskiales bacterium]
MTAAPVGGDLNQWLQWLEGLDPNHITPGLARVTEVGRRLDVLKPAPFVISIAGTNGKGSSAALLEASLLNAGHSVAVYTSPHLLRYNERL